MTKLFGDNINDVFSLDNLKSPNSGENSKCSLFSIDHCSVLGNEQGRLNGHTYYGQIGTVVRRPGLRDKT